MAERIPRKTLALGVAVAVSLMALPGAVDGGSLAGSRGLQSGKEERPNIIFILLDDLDYYDLPAYGSTDIETPSIDQMVSEGMQLTSYYANGPLCPPTRNSLMTGNYPSRHGIKRLPPDSYKGIPGYVPVLPLMLQGWGYATAHVGKWHLGHKHEEYLPSSKGYDTSLIGKTGRVQPNYGSPCLYLDDSPTATCFSQHATSVLTDFTLDFIEQNQAGPFFVNLWYFTPHTPLNCPPGFECGNPGDEDYNIRRYRAMIEYADQQIGRVFTKLFELGLDKNTIVVVTSDNGGYAANGTQAATPPGAPDLEGFKTKVFERGIRVPFMAWAPDLIPAGTVNDSVVMSFDMWQTFEQLARPEGVATRIPIDGVDVWPILSKNASVDRQETLFWELNFKDNDDGTPTPTGWYQNFAVRNGDWKLVMDNNNSWTAPRLFDLGNDPGETTNLSGQFPGLVERLMAEYWAWRKETSAVPYYVQTSSGEVTYTGGESGISFQFTGAGGLADLGDSKLFDFGEGDFSVSLKLRIDQGGTKPVIAQKPGSWILSLTNNNKVKVRLVACSDCGPQAGCELNETDTIITSDTRLVVGREYDVALTVTGFRTDNSTLRIYVNGVLQPQVSTEVCSVAVVEEPIRVGNNYNSDRPLIGEIQDLTFRLNVLTQEEIDMLVQ